MVCVSGGSFVISYHILMCVRLILLGLNIMGSTLSCLGQFADLLISKVSSLSFIDVIYQVSWVYIFFFIDMV